MEKMTYFIVMIFLLISTTIYAACPAPVGTVYTAVDGSDTEVQDCVNAADAASGGEVRIPAGTATWATGVSKTLTHNLTISGAGQSSTIITGGSSTALFSLTAPSGVTLKISDMKLISGSYNRTDGLMFINGVNNNKIISNIYFDFTGATAGRALWFYGNGVIYGCTFYMSNYGQGISFRSGLAEGDYNYWYGNPSFGTVNEAYVENCTFNFPNSAGDGAFDAYSGAKIAFRYNTVIGTNIGWHGNDSSPGAHSAEVYNNVFTDPNNKTAFTINIRGGTAVIWGNSFDSNFGSSFDLSLYRSCDSGGYDPDSICNGSGTRDFNGADPTGYPCYQQIGTTGTSGLTNWPIIEWDNNYGSGTNNMQFGLNGNFLGQSCINYGHGAIYDMSDHVKEGRDYINHNTCVGVNSEFCNTWWDDVNKKAKNYTPYTYPHPLRGPFASSHKLGVGSLIKNSEGPTIKWFE